MFATSTLGAVDGTGLTVGGLFVGGRLEVFTDGAGADDVVPLKEVSPQPKSNNISKVDIFMISPTTASSCDNQQQVIALSEFRKKT